MKKPMATAYAALLASVILQTQLQAQVDQELAAQYVQEAQALCAQEAQEIWGVSLAGPMVFFDAVTQTIATSQAEPEDKRPAFLGYANAVAQWGPERWSTYVWQHIPKEDQQARARLMIHELTHRVQPELGFFLAAGDCGHLDTLEGRYFMQLEWRALSKALGSMGQGRKQALADAMGFRWVRHDLFPEAIERERCDVIREGLAQYTGVAVVHSEQPAAIKEVQRQLKEFAQRESFVAEFAYPTGAAYGVLLDAYAAGWTRAFKPEDDLGALLMLAAKVEPNADVERSAERYGGSDLMLREERREEAHQKRVAAFRQQFIDAPVLILPRARNMSFSTAGKTSIPGAGTMFPTLRTSSPWGQLQASWALVAEDQQKVTLAAPTQVEGDQVTGEGWTLSIATGWSLKPGPRPADQTLSKD